MRILTVNAGSTSLKVREVVDGKAGTDCSSLEEAFTLPRPDAVAHRVVHGGDRVRAQIVDDSLLEELRRLTELAPLHQPPALDAMQRCRDTWPDVPHVACFDTAFHATIPPAARTYALPARLRDRVRVYGFHGLSHAWAVRCAAQLLPDAKRVVVAHLGGGQSLCAALDGRSVMTTMGFTPLDGLVMATRSGSIDPGAVLWLAAHTDERLADVLEEESGLLGLCGSGDMRVVRERANRGDEEALLALAVWRHRFVTLVGACAAALGGVDALVFTGGVGENDEELRREVTDALGWLGAEILVVASREDLQLASEAENLLTPG
jgi:acetate kinase